MKEIKDIEKSPKAESKPKAKAKPAAPKKYFFGCGNAIRVKGRDIGTVIEGRLIVEGEEDAEIVAKILNAPLREY
jgi:hypothetical protein